MTGRISFYDNTRGFGFINGEDGESVFFHISNVSATNGALLEENQLVSYDVIETEKGKAAVDVVLTSVA